MDSEQFEIANQGRPKQEQVATGLLPYAKSYRPSECL